MGSSPTTRSAPGVLTEDIVLAAALITGKGGR